MAHTLDTSARFAASANDPVSQTYTCGAGTTVLCVGLTYRDQGGGRQGGTPTYNSLALTLAGQVWQEASEVSCAIWYRLNPPTGAAYTISVPNTTQIPVAVTAISFKAPTGFGSQFDVATGNTFAATPYAVDISPSAASAMFHIAASSSNNLGTQANSHTLIGTMTDHGVWGGAAQYHLGTTGGLHSMSLTFGANSPGVAAAVAFTEYALSSIKTIQGVIRANIKTVQGLALANMKNFGGLA